MSEGQARCLKEYEYRVKATPEYIYPIDEDWEIVDVFIKYLKNGAVNFVTIFRKEDKKERK